MMQQLQPKFSVPLVPLCSGPRNRLFCVQVVDFKGVFLFMLCIVPLFHSYIHLHEGLKLVNSVNPLRRSAKAPCGKRVIRVEQRNSHDNEARNIMILNNFFSKNPSGTIPHKRNKLRNKPLRPDSLAVLLSLWLRY